MARRVKSGALLRLGPEPLSAYWANASRGIHLAGLGEIDVTDVPAIEWRSEVPELPGFVFGGWAFDATRPWKGFDAERWFVPEVLAWWDGSSTWLVGFGSSTDVVNARLDRVAEVEPSVGLSLSASSSDRDAWNRRVASLLETISSGACTKIVLAREIEVDGVTSERTLLKSLEARHPTCWTFLIRGRDGRAFIGASPETLIEARGEDISVDSLAGTAPVGEGAALLNSDKDLREHAAVVDGIRESLEPLVTRLEVPSAPVVKTLANVEHLFTPVRATLKPGVTALEAARALHPTPAVAGAPRETAMRWLRENEGFSRGWYTGAVGVRSEAGLTLAVALRSALVDGTRATVFAGAGLVAGSTADAEWHETERKSWAITGGGRCASR
ncbi:MAG: isochorismate synthase [Archangium sp.]